MANGLIIHKDGVAYPIPAIGVPILTTTDGSTSVERVSAMTFEGATVTDDGAGAVTVTVEGGGGSADPRSVWLFG